MVGGINFVNALSKSAPQHRYLITVPSDCGYEHISLPNDSEFRIYPKMPSAVSRLKLEMYTIPSAVRDFGADAVLGLGNHGLMNIDCPQAIWIRNGYLVYPSKHFSGASLKTRAQIKLQRMVLRRCLTHTDLLFCQTPIMRQRIAEYYNYDTKNIKTLPNALSVFSHNRKNDGTAKVPEDIAEDKFNCLILTNYCVHKNPQIILDAYLKVPDRFDGIRFITTVSEHNCSKAGRFIKRIQRDGPIRDVIRNSGPIAHNQLELYYRNAQLVIMPTLMESFSITYMEAMSFGVPILTSDLDFAHYLAGDAALYYDPWDLESFIERLLILKSDMKVRKRLIEAGYDQLKKFPYTWEDMVKTAIGELERLVTSTTMSKVQTTSRNRENLKNESL